jgi:hypothetical protein
VAQRKAKVGDVVLVEWHDIAARHLHWADRDTARQESHPLKVASAGYVLKINKRVLVLVQSVSVETADVQQSLTIPHRVIDRVRVLYRD